MGSDSKVACHKDTWMVAIRKYQGFNFSVMQVVLILWCVIWERVPKGFTAENGKMGFNILSILLLLSGNVYWLSRSHLWRLKDFSLLKCMSIVLLGSVTGFYLLFLSLVSSLMWTGLFINASRVVVGASKSLTQTVQNRVPGKWKQSMEGKTPNFVLSALLGHND